jgi:hypothetical protein
LRPAAAVAPTGRQVRLSTEQQTEICSSGHPEMEEKFKKQANSAKIIIDLVDFLGYNVAE